MDSLSRFVNALSAPSEWSWMTWSIVSSSSLAALVVGARHVYQIRQKHYKDLQQRKEQEEKEREFRLIQLQIQALRFPQLYELALLRSQRRMARKKVHLYFDSNDEFILDEQYYSLAQDETMNNLLFHSVLVNFESEQQQLEGTHKITPSIFQGTSGDKTENAMCFIENLDKTKQYKFQEAHDMLNEVTDGDTASRSADNDQLTFISGDSSLAEAHKEALNQSQVILNISPQKFEKPKDQLFIDFFSMYTKRFVKDKRKKKPTKRTNFASNRSNIAEVSSIQEEDIQ